MLIEAFNLLFGFFFSFCIYSHHVFVKIPKDVQLAEVGPRFEMKRRFYYLLFFYSMNGLVDLSGVAYEIRQGTIEQMGAEKEWVLSHYTRTARKRNVLSGRGPPSQPDEPVRKKVKR